MRLYQDVTFGAASSIMELMRIFKEYKEQKSKEELSSPEWKELEQAYVKHLLWRFEYPEKVHKQKIIATWLVVAIVIFMVFCGIAFSYWQLQTAISLQDFSSLKTDLAIETAGSLSLGSSVVGAVVLSLSLAFFFLYLKHVFSQQSLTPPHLSILDTDAAKVYGKEAADLTPELEEELENVMRKHGYPDHSYHLWVKYNLHGATVGGANNQVNKDASR